MCGLFFVLVTCTVGASAFRLQQVKSTENCPHHTVYFKHYYELHGEPVVLKCPSPRYKHLDFSALTPNITWYKNGSKTMISGRDEDPRIWAKGDALWFLPAMLEDSGVYICTRRNSSYCAEVSIHLTVMEKTAAQEIAYLQVLFTFTSGKIVCPDLWDFAPNRTSLELKWYKDSLPLEADSGKFIILKGSTSLIMNSVLPADSGYYTCKMSFPFEDVMYEITRTIHLKTVEKEKRITPIIVYPTQKTTSAALGSKMTLPCKVFVGLSGHVHTDVEWLANDTTIDVIYKQSRVTEGERHEVVENGENFIEVPLIFDSVEEVDFYTDFTCLAQNRYGYQVLPTRVKQEAVGLSWYIAMIPITLACVTMGGICIHKCWKRRADKGYTTAKSQIQLSWQLQTYELFHRKCTGTDIRFLTQSESKATKEDHWTYSFRVQEGDDKRYIYFMDKWEKGGHKCGKQSTHLDICSLKEENYRLTDHCWKKHQK